MKILYWKKRKWKFSFFKKFDFGSFHTESIKKGHFWKWLSLIWIKFGTIVGLYEKLPNTKFEANPTSMSRVMAIWNFGLEAKISKIGLIQEAVAPSILKISSKFQRILVRIFKAHFFGFEVILISRNFRGRPAASNLQPRFSTKTPPSIWLNFLYCCRYSNKEQYKEDSRMESRL